MRLTGTLRSLTLPGLAQLQHRVREIATHVAAAIRCEATVEVPGNDYPPTLNDAHCWGWSRDLSNQISLGEGAAEELSPVMGGEDFAYYLQHMPGCFVGLGCRNERLAATYNVHHPKFKV